MEQFNQAQLRRGVLPRSIDCRQIKLRAFERWLAERGLELFDARQSDVENFLDQRHISPRTRYDWISHLHAFYAWAVTEGLTDYDPTRRIIRPKLRRNLPRPAATDDILRALDLSTPKAKCWLLLAAFQGLRCQEIAGLRREDVVEGEGLLRVVHGKGNVERIMPIHPDVLASLRHLPMPKTGWVFRRPLGGAYTPDQLSIEFRAFLEHCGLTAKPHQLRHWFASHLYAQTKDLRLVQEMLGHASPTTTAIYVAFDRQQAGKAIGDLSLEDAAC